MEENSWVVMLEIGVWAVGIIVNEGSSYMQLTRGRHMVGGADYPTIALPNVAIRLVRGDLAGEEGHEKDQRW